MSKIKSFFAYLLAFLGVPIIMATLMGMNVWAELLVKVTGVTITPWFSGGEIVMTIPHDGGYETRIHEPVFAALIGERSQGFVQIDWAPKNLTPGVIDEEVDYNGDGSVDFHIRWEPLSKEATLTPRSAFVLGLEGIYILDESYTIRVNLSNPHK
jgi:hypothetical protein